MKSTVVHSVDHVPLILSEPCFSQPGVYDGAGPTNISNQLSLSPLQAPFWPSFYFEVKGPTGEPAEATHQVCVDSPHCARGSHAAKNVAVPRGIASRNREEKRGGGAGRNGSECVTSSGGSVEAYHKALALGANTAPASFVWHFAPETHAYAGAT